jgi:carbonic anhydrase/acetyltransferase-like protein (isoleucine patch superfamily)
LFHANGDLPAIHESAYVDKTAIICGKIIIEENVFVGPYPRINLTGSDLHM